MRTHLFNPGNPGTLDWTRSISPEIRGHPKNYFLVQSLYNVQQGTTLKEWGAAVVIVYGFLEIQKGKRKAFLSGSREAILAARQNKSCLDFSVSADLIEENRVNIFESWKTKKALNEFRGSGPGEDLSAHILNASIEEREVK